MVLSGERKIMRYVPNAQNLGTPEEININLGDSGKLSALAVSLLGSLYVSDEERGVIFKITPSGP